MEAAKRRGAYQIWSFGPRLLDGNGKAFASNDDFVSTVKGANPRSAIGYYEPAITARYWWRGGRPGIPRGCPWCSSRGCSSPLAAKRPIISTAGNRR